MGQFAAAIRGMAAACEALDFPVVSGNVSLYNETARAGGDPADAGDRRPRRAGRCGEGGGHRAAAVARRRADRRHQGLARPVALAARDRRPRGGRAAAGRSGRRTRQRRFRPRADPGRARSAPATTCRMAACWSRWRRWRWRAATGVRLFDRPARHPRPCLLVRRGPGPLCARGARRRRAVRAAEAAGLPAVRHRHIRRTGFDTARWRHNIRCERCARRTNASSRPGWTTADQEETTHGDGGERDRGADQGGAPRRARHRRGPRRRRRPLRRDRGLRAVPRPHRACSSTRSSMPRCAAGWGASCTPSHCRPPPPTKSSARSSTDGQRRVRTHPERHRRQTR